MFSRLVPITTMWTGWGFNLASGAESVELQLVDCSLCLSRNSRRNPCVELTTTAFQIPVSRSEIRWLVTYPTKLETDRLPVECKGEADCLMMEIDGTSS